MIGMPTYYCIQELPDCTRLGSLYWTYNYLCEKDLYSHSIQWCSVIVLLVHKSLCQHGSIEFPTHMPFIQKGTYGMEGRPIWNTLHSGTCVVYISTKYQYIHPTTITLMTVFFIQTEWHRQVPKQQKSMVSLVDKTQCRVCIIDFLLMLLSTCAQVTVVHYWKIVVHRHYMVMLLIWKGYVIVYNDTSYCKLSELCCITGPNFNQFQINIWLVITLVYWNLLWFLGK